MLSQLVISTLILGSLVAGLPPPTTIPPPEDPALEGHEALINSSQLILKGTGDLKNGEAVAIMANFRCTFLGYEKRVKTFLEDVKIEEQSLRNDGLETFLGELRTYVDLLPKNETRVVKKRSRETCVCDGRRVSPCPEKCMNSCEWTNNEMPGWAKENDCESAKSRMDSCYCYEGSSSRCDNGALSNCYEEKTELEEVTSPCSEYAVNQTLLEKIFSRSVELHVEPLRKQVRRLGYQLSSFKQSLTATDLLFNFTNSLCEEQYETPCFPEVSNILSQKLTKFNQLKRNITNDVIRLQESVEIVSSNVAKWKEQTFSQIQAMIKGYTSCLKELGVYAKTEKRGPRDCPDEFFQCDDQRCISKAYVCDGDNDCGDMSDEANC